MGSLSYLCTMKIWYIQEIPSPVQGTYRYLFPPEPWNFEKTADFFLIVECGSCSSLLYRVSLACKMCDGTESFVVAINLIIFSRNLQILRLPVPQSMTKTSGTTKHLCMQSEYPKPDNKCHGMVWLKWPGKPTMLWPDLKTPLVAQHDTVC